VLGIVFQLGVGDGRAFALIPRVCFAAFILCLAFDRTRPALSTVLPLPGISSSICASPHRSGSRKRRAGDSASHLVARVLELHLRVGPGRASTVRACRARSFQYRRQGRHAERLCKEEGVAGSPLLPWPWSSRRCPPCASPFATRTVAYRSRARPRGCRSAANRCGVGRPVSDSLSGWELQGGHGDMEEIRKGRWMRSAMGRMARCGGGSRGWDWEDAALQRRAREHGGVRA
jgi:hypothetical protein